MLMIWQVGLCGLLLVLMRKCVIFLIGFCVVDSLICSSGCGYSVCRCFSDSVRWLLCLLLVRVWILLMIMLCILVSICWFDFELSRMYSDLGVVIRMCGGCLCIVLCLICGVLLVCIVLWILMLGRLRCVSFLWMLVSGCFRLMWMLLDSVFSGEIQIIWVVFVNLLLVVSFFIIRVSMVVRKVVRVLFELVGVVIRVESFLWIVGQVLIWVGVGVVKWCLNYWWMVGWNFVRGCGVGLVWWVEEDEIGIMFCIMVVLWVIYKFC